MVIRFYPASDRDLICIADSGYSLRALVVLSVTYFNSGSTAKIMLPGITFDKKNENRRTVSIQDDVFTGTYLNLISSIEDPADRGFMVKNILRSFIDYRFFGSVPYQQPIPAAAAAGRKSPYKKKIEKKEKTFEEKESKKPEDVDLVTQYLNDGGWKKWRTENAASASDPFSFDVLKDHPRLVAAYEHYYPFDSKNFATLLDQIKLNYERAEMVKNRMAERKGEKREPQKIVNFLQETVGRAEAKAEEFGDNTDVQAADFSDTAALATRINEQIKAHGYA